MPPNVAWLTKVHCRGQLFVRPHPADTNTRFVRHQLIELGKFFDCTVARYVSLQTI
jgi:hypothetical protein